MPQVDGLRCETEDTDFPESDIAPDGQEIWDAWVAGRYMVGSVLILVLGIAPLVKGYVFGLVPLALVVLC